MRIVPDTETSNFRYRGLVGAEFNVAELERSIDFYRELVGLERVERSDDHAAFRCGDAGSTML